MIFGRERESVQNIVLCALFVAFSFIVRKASRPFRLLHTLRESFVTHRTLNAHCHSFTHRWQIEFVIVSNKIKPNKNNIFVLFIFFYIICNVLNFENYETLGSLRKKANICCINKPYARHNRALTCHFIK